MSIHRRPTPARPKGRHSLTTRSNTNRTPLPATGVRQVNEESLPTVRTHTADEGETPEPRERPGKQCGWNFSLMRLGNRAHWGNQPDTIGGCKMPNHVTTELKAPAQVLSAMLNEEGRIDFNKLLPFEGEFSLDVISGAAETAAEKVLGLPTSDNPLLGSLQMANRDRVDVKGLSDSAFEQFLQMLKNHRKTGFMRTLDFAIANWGTKWNAYDQSVDLEAGSARMDTAWSFPEPVLLKLSALFPDAQLDIRYADEDIGSNCGTVVIKGGAVLSRDESGRWDDMTKDEQDKWRAFAYEVKGWEPGEDAE